MLFLKFAIENYSRYLRFFHSRANIKKLFNVKCSWNSETCFILEPVRLTTEIVWLFIRSSFSVWTAVATEVTNITWWVTVIFIYYANNSMWKCVPSWLWYVYKPSSLSLILTTLQYMIHLTVIGEVLLVHEMALKI